MTGCSDVIPARMFAPGTVSPNQHRNPLLHPSQKLFTLMKRIGKKLQKMDSKKYLPAPLSIGQNTRESEGIWIFSKRANRIRLAVDGCPLAHSPACTFALSISLNNEQIVSQRKGCKRNLAPVYPT